MQAEPSLEKSDTAGHAAQPKRRLWLRLAVGAAILAVLAIIVFVAPTYVARYIVAEQLAEMGIETEGAETIDIDVWHQELWLGPVRFRDSQAQVEFGELKRIGVRVSWTHLFQKYVLIERVIIEGLNLAVVEDTDGALRINGVNLTELTKSEGVPEEQPAADDSASPWLPGLGSFEFRDSQISYTNAAGGRLIAEIDQILLNDFYEWSPQDPGTFSAKGTINSMPFAWQGEAWPFADTIRASVDGRVHDINMANIETFTGSLGLERHDGTLSSDLHYEVTWAPEGRLTIDITGHMNMANVDAMPPDGPLIRLAGGHLELDNQVLVDDKATIKASGEAVLSLQEATVATPDDATVSLPETELKITDINVTWPVEGKRRIEAAASLGVSGPIFSLSQSPDAPTATDTPTPPLELTAQKVSAELEKLTFEQSAGVIILSLKGGKQVDAAKAVVPGQSGDGTLSVTIETISQTFSDFRFEQSKNEGKLEGAIDLTLKTIAAEVPVENAIANISTQGIALNAPSIDMTLDGEGSRIITTANTMLEAFEVELPKSAVAPAVDASIGGLTLDLNQFTVDQRANDIALKGALEAAIETVEANLEQGEVGKLSLNKLSIRDGSLNGSIGQQLEIAAAEILLTSPSVEITDRTLTVFGSGNEPSSSDVLEENSQPAAARSANIKVGRLAVTEEGTLVYIDTSVQPRVRVQSDIEILEAENINTGEPDQPMNVRLDSTVNEFTKVQLVGWVAPFLQPPTFEFAGRIGDLALPALSPYAAQAVGMNLQQGSLTAKADAAAKENGELNGRIKIDVNNLAFTPLSKEDAERLSAQIGLPIDTIIGLLRDSDGEIELTIPVSGDIKDPSFDFTNAIAKAFRGALTAAITAPFEILFAPVQIVADAAAGAPVAFKPVTFSPGATEIDPQSRTFLNALVDMLEKRPDLRLQVCGHATAQDFQAVQTAQPTPANPPQPRSGGQAQGNPVADRKAEAQAARPQLQKLAEDRGRAVRRFIVQENNVKAERIGECRSEVDATDQGPPRVEITF